MCSGVSFFHLQMKFLTFTRHNPLTMLATLYPCSMQTHFFHVEGKLHVCMSSKIRLINGKQVKCHNFHDANIRVKIYLIVLQLVVFVS